MAALTFGAAEPAGSEVCGDAEVAAVHEQVLEDGQLEVERVLLRHDAKAAPDLGPVGAGVEPEHAQHSVAHGRDGAPIIRIVELLPAPFGPRNPNVAPRSTAKSIPSTATNVPNRFVRPRASIRCAPGVTRPTLPAVRPRTDGPRQDAIEPGRSVPRPAVGDVELAEAGQHDDDQQNDDQQRHEPLEPW